MSERWRRRPTRGSLRAVGAAWTDAMWGRSSAAPSCTQRPAPAECSSLLHKGIERRSGHQMRQVKPDQMAHWVVEMISARFVQQAQICACRRARVDCDSLAQVIPMSVVGVHRRASNIALRDLRIPRAHRCADPLDDAPQRAHRGEPARQLWRLPACAAALRRAARRRMARVIHGEPAQH